MRTSELLSNRVAECAECGDRLRPSRLCISKFCKDCEELLANLKRVEEERNVKSLLGKPWWWFHNPLNAHAFALAQKKGWLS
jgi:hypothetical protein